MYTPLLLELASPWKSWIHHCSQCLFSFDLQAVPARTTIGLLTVLTVTTQTTYLLQTLPSVSYVKAIDVWMVACLLFVFAAFLEYATVNVMDQVSSFYIGPKIIWEKMNRNKSTERNWKVAFIFWSWQPKPLSHKIIFLLVEGPLTV